MEEKLTKYFPKEWRQDSGKVKQLFAAHFSDVSERLLNVLSTLQTHGIHVS